MGRKVELEGRRTVVKVVVHQNKILCHEDPVKSIKIFIGCHPRFFRVASAQIFVRVAAWKMLGVILPDQKKIGEHPEKNLGRCYPKNILGDTL